MTQINEDQVLYAKQEAPRLLLALLFVTADSMYQISTFITVLHNSRERVKY